MPFSCNHSSYLAKINKPEPFKRERDFKEHLWVEHKVPGLFECGKNHKDCQIKQLVVSKLCLLSY